MLGAFDDTLLNHRYPYFHEKWGHIYGTKPAKNGGGVQNVKANRGLEGGLFYNNKFWHPNYDEFGFVHKYWDTEERKRIKEIRKTK